MEEDRKNTMICPRQIIALFAVASLVAVALSGLAMVAHSSDGNMVGGCPFSTPSAFLCPQNLQAAVIHHLSSYYSFFNVTVGGSIAALIISLLLTVWALFFLLSGPPLPRLFGGNFVGVESIASHDQKITRWLALLENSPSRS